MSRTKASAYKVKPPRPIHRKSSNSTIARNSGSPINERITNYLRQHPGGGLGHFLTHCAPKLPVMDINVIRAYYVVRHRMIKEGVLKNVPKGRQSIEDKNKLLTALTPKVKAAYEEWLAYARKRVAAALTTKPTKPLKPTKPSKPSKPSRVSVTVNKVTATKSKKGKK